MGNTFSHYFATCLSPPPPAPPPPRPSTTPSRRHFARWDPAVAAEPRSAEPHEQPPRRVYLLGPGSGEAGPLLHRAPRLTVCVAVGPAYDAPGRRMPPGWTHMHGVFLDEVAAAEGGVDVAHLGRPRADAKNLATWSSVIYRSDGDAATLWAIDVDAAARAAGELRVPSPHTLQGLARQRRTAGRDRRASREFEDAVKAVASTPARSPSGREGLHEQNGAITYAQFYAIEENSAVDADGAPAAADAAEDHMAPRDAAGFDCLVCGSRGGQVTLPALWRLGCRLPCVVLNGGCAREEAAWVWPTGVSVVLLTGGDDFFVSAVLTVAPR